MLLLFLLQMYAGLFSVMHVLQFKIFADNITDPTKLQKFSHSISLMAMKKTIQKKKIQQNI